MAALLLAGTWHLSGAVASQGLLWMVVWMLAAALSCWWLRHEALPSGTLAWDGEAWWHEAHTNTTALTGRTPVTVQVLLDAGSSMLVGVRAQADGRQEPWRGQRFAWLGAAGMPSQIQDQAPGQVATWHAWRCAVYAQDIL